MAAHPAVRRTLRQADALWRVLRRPWLAALLAALLLALLLLQQVIPQVPGQIVDDPAAAVRWVNAESDRWGSMGALMEGLGLFEMDSSPLFHLVLGLLALLMLVHLADALQAAWSLRALETAMQEGPPGEAVETGWPGRLARQRAAYALQPELAAAALDGLLARRFGAPTRREVAAEPGPEVRLLGVQRKWLAWVRPLLPLGALLALIGLWGNGMWGWSIASGEIAPGDTFSVPTRAVSVRHEVDAEADPPAAQMRVEQETAGAAVLAAGDSVRLPGGVTAHVTTASPALLLTTAEPLLARPDDLEPRAAVGLIFPQVGSEQVVVLPDAGAGARVVRLASNVGSRFLVELFAPDEVEPVERLEVTGRERVRLPAGERTLELELVPMSGVTVTLEREPFGWLLLAGLLLVVAGLGGWALPASFALVQVRPWPEGRAEVTVQTPLEDFGAEVEVALGEEAPATPA